MGHPASPNDREFLVQGTDVGSEPFTKHVEDDPDVSTLQRIAPDMVVLAMSPDATRRLRARFGPALQIEPNADLVPP